MPYYANGLWYTWSSTLQNITSTNDPITAIISNTTNTALPWFWPAIPFIIYLWLFIVYRDSPTRFKFVFIAGLGLVISIFMAGGGLIVDAVENVVIFGIAIFASQLFKS